MFATNWEENEVAGQNGRMYWQDNRGDTMEHKTTQNQMVATWNRSRNSSTVWKSIGWVFFALAAVGLIPLSGFTVVLVTGGPIHPDGWVMLSIVLPSMAVLSAIGLVCHRVARSRVAEPQTTVTGQEANTSQHQFQVANAQGIVWFLGIGAVCGGILGLAGILPLSPWPTLVGGVAFCALAYQIRKQSRSALLAALALLGCGLLWNIIVVVRTFAAGGFPLIIGGTAFGLGLFFALVRVFRRTSHQAVKEWWAPNNGEQEVAFDSLPAAICIWTSALSARKEEVRSGYDRF
jgi:hypothetical protein